MEEKTDIKAKTIKVDTGKGNTIKVTMSYGAYCEAKTAGFAEQNGRIPFLNSRIATSLCNLILIMIVAIPGMVNTSF